MTFATIVFNNLSKEKMEGVEREYKLVVTKFTGGVVFLRDKLGRCLSRCSPRQGCAETLEKLFERGNTGSRALKVRKILN